MPCHQCCDSKILGIDEAKIVGGILIQERWEGILAVRTNKGGADFCSIKYNRKEKGSQT